MRDTRDLGERTLDADDVRDGEVDFGSEVSVNEVWGEAVERRWMGPCGETREESETCGDAMEEREVCGVLKCLEYDGVSSDLPPATKVSSKREGDQSAKTIPGIQAKK